MWKFQNLQNHHGLTGETTADEFVQVYLGQHAELKSSSELQLDRKEEKIQNLWLHGN